MARSCIAALVAWSMAIASVSAEPAPTVPSSQAADMAPMTVPVTISEDEAGEPSSTALIASAAGLAGVYVGLGVWTYFAWYHDVDTLPDFEIGGDGYFGRDTYAGGADKMGHYWSNYAITRATSWILTAGGWSQWKASLIAGGLSLAFFTYVEIKDGFYYQLSPGDQIGNTLGVALAVLLDNVPAIDEVIDLRLQYWPSSEYRRRLVDDGDLDIAEDYSGQTYVIGLHLAAIPGLTEPKWMNWARYVDVMAGFESRNYLPEPTEEGARRRQSVFVGLSFNFQHALGALYGEEPRRLSHKIGHNIAELYLPPYTSVRVGESTRRAPAEPAATASP